MALQVAEIGGGDHPLRVYSRVRRAWAAIEADAGAVTPDIEYLAQRAALLVCADVHIALSLLGHGKALAALEDRVEGRNDLRETIDRWRSIRPNGRPATQPILLHVFYGPDQVHAAALGGGLPMRIPRLRIFSGHLVLPRQPHCERQRIG